MLEFKWMHSLSSISVVSFIGSYPSPYTLTPSQIETYICINKFIHANWMILVLVMAWAAVKFGINTIHECCIEIYIYFSVQQEWYLSQISLPIPILVCIC